MIGDVNHFKCRCFIHHNFHPSNLREGQCTNWITRITHACANITHMHMCDDLEGDSIMYNDEKI